MMTDIPRLLEMRVRVGGDPRGFSEFKTLSEELAKLNHPACPDIDWVKVEQLCLALFSKNGAELQSVAAYTLARSHLHGLEGMTQSVMMIEALVGEWSSLWPAAASERLDCLAWLFAQLQPLLRGLEVHAWNLSVLAHLSTGLERLSGQLARQIQEPLLMLEVVRQQLASLIRRQEQPLGLIQSARPILRGPEPALVAPIIILPSAPPPEAFRPRKRKIAVWLGATVATILLAGGVAWWGWLADSDGHEISRQTGLFQRQHLSAEPVQLDSLHLFTPGSAEIKPDSTRLLINTLAEIKARPNNLIVITGHSDTTGDTAQNLHLSQARAMVVRDWMQRMGEIEERCFAVQGVADSQPVASNETEAGRAANRRIDIRLMPHAAC
jgi:type VI secretion system protein VasL